MKIGLVCPYNMYRSGGVQASLLAHQHELVKRGHDVKIIAPRPRSAPKKESNGILLVGQSTELNTPFHTMVDVGVSLDVRELNELLAREKFEILHFHEPWVPLISMQLLSRSKAINVATFHAKLPDTLLNKSFEKVIQPYTKSVFKQLDALIAVSEVAAQYVGQISPLPVNIIPNGIDLYALDRNNVKPYKKYQSNKKTLLFIGRLEKRKGTIHLLKAYRRLRAQHDNVRLVVAGDGHKRGMLEGYIRRYDVPDVEFVGYVDEETKLRLLKSADLFVSPALYGESFGIVLLEAMAMGIVTVAGNNDGYATVMKERGRIALVDPTDTKEFFHRLELMLFDEHVRSLWLEWAKNSVGQYDYPIVVNQIEKLYKELMASAKK